MRRPKLHKNPVIHPAGALLVVWSLLFLTAITAIVLTRNDITPTSHRSSNLATTPAVTNTQAIDQSLSAPVPTAVTDNSTTTPTNSVSMTTINENGTVSTELDVNGHTITVPPNSSTNQTIVNNSGSSTTITASSTQSLGAPSSRSSTHSRLSVHSTTSISTQTGGTNTTR